MASEGMNVNLHLSLLSALTRRDTITVGVTSRCNALVRTIKHLSKVVSLQSFFRQIGGDFHFKRSFNMMITILIGYI